MRSSNFEEDRHCFSLLGEELAGSEKLDLAKFCRTFGVLSSVLLKFFYYAKGSAEPSCRTLQVLQHSGLGGGGGLAAQARLLCEDWFFPPICGWCNSWHTLIGSAI